MIEAHTYQFEDIFPKDDQLWWVRWFYTIVISRNQRDALLRQLGAHASGSPLRRIPS